MLTSEEKWNVTLGDNGDRGGIRVPGQSRKEYNSPEWYTSLPLCPHCSRLQVPRALVVIQQTFGGHLLCCLWNSAWSTEDTIMDKIQFRTLENSQSSWDYNIIQKPLVAMGLLLWQPHQASPNAPCWVWIYLSYIPTNLSVLDLNFFKALLSDYSHVVDHGAKNLFFIRRPLTINLLVRK